MKKNVKKIDGKSWFLVVCEGILKKHQPVVTDNIRSTPGVKHQQVVTDNIRTGSWPLNDWPGVAANEQVVMMRSLATGSNVVVVMHIVLVVL